MRSTHFRHAMVVVAAVAATLLCLAAFGGPTTSLIVIGTLLAAAISRLPFLIHARWAVKVPVVLFCVSQGLWALSDVLRGFSDARAGGVALPGAEAAAAAGSGIFCVVILWTVYLRGRPRTETWLDAGIFVVALAPALWLLVIAPTTDLQGDPWVAVWAVVTLLLMFVGGVFLLSGGIWNAPSVALVIGVIGSVVTDIAMRIPDATAPAAEPHFLVALMCAIFVARDPELPNVFEKGGRRTGIPLDARVWMLAMVLALPIGALGFTYVKGDAAPIATISASVG
ncbi:MAG: hypothetical protein J7513_15975, partial [Solirubrobacteraceae bacterium]|nr:hypothetical protein [Solirubrobacteraceae bacterium]